MTDSYRPAPLSVLLVGEPGWADSSAALLGQLGYEVRLARSAAEALAAVVAFAPDVAVLGPGLSDADRDAVAERLVAAAAGRPLLVVLTGDGHRTGDPYGAEFDHVRTTDDPAGLAALLTDYALVCERCPASLYGPARAAPALPSAASTLPRRSSSRFASPRRSFGCVSTVVSPNASS